MKYIKKNYGEIIFIISFFSLVIGFFFNEDGTGMPLSGDFRDTLPYVNELKKNLFIDPSPWTVHFPLHYIFISWLDLILNNIYVTRLIFCLLSASVPLVFYLCLKTKFKNNKNNLLILSSIVFLTPSFRYSAIWANDHVFASFFFYCHFIFF